MTASTRFTDHNRLLMWFDSHRLPATFPATTIGQPIATAVRISYCPLPSATGLSLTPDFYRSCDCVSSAVVLSLAREDFHRNRSLSGPQQAEAVTVGLHAAGQPDRSGGAYACDATGRHAGTPRWYGGVAA